MAEIYQAFSLDEEEKKKEAKDVQKGRGKKLIEGLVSKGYIVLVSGYYIGDLPASIIVGAKVIAELPNIKEDFSEIANKLGIVYRAGRWYRKQNN